MPDWLEKFGQGQGFSVEKFLQSPIVFYAGSGFDGSPVEHFGSSGSAYCFVFADYGVSKAEIEAQLDDPLLGFRGYKSIYRASLLEKEITPDGWRSHIQHFEVPSGAYVHATVEPYAFIEILERNPTLDERYGPMRLAVLFVGGDGVATYDALFCQKAAVPPPIAVVLQDHGFGGGYTSFGRNGLLERVAKRAVKLPKFLWIATDSTEPWSGYQVIEGLESMKGGQWRNQRRLYEQKSYTYDELSQITDLAVRQIKYYVQEGLIAGPWGKTRGAKFREEQLLQLQLVRDQLMRGISVPKIKNSLNMLRGLRGDWDSESQPIQTENFSAPARETKSHWVLDVGIELVVDPIRSKLNQAQLSKFIESVARQYQEIKLECNE
jgi:DNA-binding transcriptional MerR regulator